MPCREVSAARGPMYPGTSDTNINTSAVSSCVQCAQSKALSYDTKLCFMACIWNEIAKG